jgi:hypothetical protein
MTHITEELSNKDSSEYKIFEAGWDKVVSQQLTCCFALVIHTLLFYGISYKQLLKLRNYFCGVINVKKNVWEKMKSKLMECSCTAITFHVLSIRMLE